MPARRIGTNTSFLPSMSLEFIVSSGVWIITSCIGMLRVTS